MTEPILFAHVSWMPDYLGKPDEPMFSTHGYVLENQVGHERWNFKPEGGKIRGYVPIRDKELEDAPGEIAIENLGSSRSAKSVDGITVVWFANNPRNAKEAYIVGWYKNATVYREAQYRRHRQYRMACNQSDAKLLDERDRNFLIPHVRSRLGQKLGYGYGQSSVWYARKAAAGFLLDIRNYIASVERLSSIGKNQKVMRVDDAINDLDGEMGNENPEQLKSSTTYFVRDPEVRRSVIARADGRCEFCGVLGFEKDDGSRFVEAHHIIALAQQGPDTLDNVIGLCPNHHREAHFGRDRAGFEEKLKAKLVEIRGKN